MTLGPPTTLFDAPSGTPARKVVSVAAPWGPKHAGSTTGLPWMAARALRGRGFKDLRVYAVDRAGRVQPCRGTAAVFSAGWILSAGQAGAVPLIEALLTEVAPDARSWGLVPSAKDKTLLFVQTGHAALVVRLPHASAAVSAEQRAYDVLRSLESTGLAPRPHGSGQLGAQAYFVEEHLPGRPVANGLQDTHRTALAKQAESLLQALNPHLVQSPVCAVGDFIGCDVHRHVRSVLECLPERRDREHVEPLLLETVLPARSRLGRVHGDFSAANLFIHQDKLIGVVDWEDSLPAAPPVLDVLNHLDSMQRRCHGQTLVDTIPQLARGDWPHAAERDWLDRAYHRSGVSDGDRFAMVLLYWLLHVGPQLAFAGAGAAAARQVTSVLERVLPWQR